MNSSTDSTQPLIDHDSLPSHVIGIGASAGGLEALERFFRAMPVDSGFAFVVIQHLSPDFKSLMNELLERFTSMAAIPVIDSIEVRANTIFLLPPRKDIVIEGNRLITREREKDGVLSLPINTFFRSLAAAWSDRAVAVVLSGTGSDGSNGLLDVRDAGGLVLVQTPESARFDGMPQSAINTGCVDAILTPEDMPSALLAFASNPSFRNFSPYGADEDSTVTGLPAILGLLKKNYNIDSSNYKPATIMRRIERRVAMDLNGEDIDSYSRRLINDASELNQLYKDLLIGVTRFFRDAEAFTILRNTVVPQMLSDIPPEEEVRIWICGCSTGEEAYSIAILFLEAFKHLNRSPQLKILATDLHQESLQTAAEGIYAQDRFADMPTELRDAYFERVGDSLFKVLPHLRKALIFSSHNLLKDPPFTKLHMVSCRNLLIYLQPRAQTRAIATFHYALKLSGVLFLGASETLGDLSDEMDTIDRQWKIFRKVRESNLVMNMRNQVATVDTKFFKPPTSAVAQLPRVYDCLLDKFIPNGILVNELREIVHIFGAAARYIQASSGRFSGDILAMMPHPLSLALSTAFRSAAKSHLPVVLKGIHFDESDQQESRLVLTVDPIHEKTSNALFFMVRIEPEAVVTVESLVSPALNFDPNSESALQVKELELELQKTRESLQSTVEELETTNEELQASNEELLASNEELQSTNEELHSVNEELYSVNAEHELKIEELNQLSSNLRNLMQSTDTATIFVDSDYRIRLYTPRALEIFNLMPQDIGRSLKHFQPNIDDPHLFDDLARVLERGSEVERHLKCGDLQSYLRRCMGFRDIAGKQAGVVVNYVDTSSITQITQALEESEAQLKLILQTVPNAVFVVARSGEIVIANDFAQGLFGYAGNEMLGMSVNALLPPELRAAHEKLMQHYFEAPSVMRMAEGKLLSAVRKNGTTLKVEVALAPIRMNKNLFVVAVVTDVTERKEFEENTQAALVEARKLAETQSRFLANMSHEIRTPLNAILGFAEIAERSLDVPEKARDALQKISTSGKHLLAVVNDILDFSKLDAGRMKVELVPVSLYELLHECVDLYRETAEKNGLLLSIKIDETLPASCLIDPLRLKQVLINLLGNAVKFTESGKVVLQAGMLKNELKFQITDTGIGMTQEQLITLFKPFSQADLSATRKYGGTGLGLVISNKLVQLMGGSISVSSRYREGSCFTVSLPYRPAKTVVVQPEVDSAEEFDFDGVHILLVEDVEFNRMLVEEILIAVGIRVTTAENGLEAVDAVEKAGPNGFDLVLMDIQMPQMDGYEATRRILKIAPDLPIVGLTANVFAEDRQSCLEAGMIDHLPKPINRAKLLSSIGRYLNKG
ncbi:MAG: hypothetical protein Kow0065_02370 [Methylomicrobium sp.]